MSATLLADVLRRFKAEAKTDVFIETGTYDGRGVEFAIMCGFKEIHSIEIDPARYKACAIKYMPFMDVHVYHGDTLELLGPLVERLEKKAVIWIDAHPIGAGDTCPRGLAEWPLLGEMSILKRGLRKDHTLLLDDRNCWNSLFKTTDEEVRKAILEINPKYEFSLEPNAMYPQDVLAAQVKG